jgi:hypothetical protein
MRGLTIESLHIWHHIPRRKRGNEERRRNGGERKQGRGYKSVGEEPNTFLPIGSLNRALDRRLYSSFAIAADLIEETQRKRERRRERLSSEGLWNFPKMPLCPSGRD